MVEDIQAIYDKHKVCLNNIKLNLALELENNSICDAELNAVEYNITTLAGVLSDMYKFLSSKKKISVSNHIINMHMGQSKDWLKYFSPLASDEINKVNYTGKLNYTAMTMQDYLDDYMNNSNTLYTITLVKADCGDYIQEYLLTIVKY